MTEITVYHNPACGTSRNVLEILKARGIEPKVIEYLKNPPSRKELESLIRRMATGVRALLRQKGTPYDELGLADLKWTDSELVGFILKHPILMNRPVVATSKGVRLCRPAEMVLELLE